MKKTVVQEKMRTIVSLHCLLLRYTFPVIDRRVAGSRRSSPSAAFQFNFFQTLLLLNHAEAVCVTWANGSHTAGALKESNLMES